MGHVHPETMRELEQELTGARKGILECQTRILALEESLRDCVDSLEYVNRVHPEASGYGVRALRVKAAQDLLK